MNRKINLLHFPEEQNNFGLTEIYKVQFYVFKSKITAMTVTLSKIPRTYNHM